MSDVLNVELAKLFAAYPKANGEPYDDLTTEVYLDDLSVIPDGEVAVVMRYVRGHHASGFLPSIGEIKEAWCDLALAGCPTEGQAIEWMMREVNAIGGPRASSHPVLAEMVRIYPFSRLAPSEDNDFTRRDLARAYQQARETVSKRVMAGELAPPPLALAESSRPALKAVS